MRTRPRRDPRCVSFETPPPFTAPFQGSRQPVADVAGTIVATPISIAVTGASRSPARSADRYGSMNRAAPRIGAWFVISLSSLAIELLLRHLCLPIRDCHVLASSAACLSSGPIRTFTALHPFQRTGRRRAAELVPVDYAPASSLREPNCCATMERRDSAR